MWLHIYLKLLKNQTLQVLLAVSPTRWSQQLSSYTRNTHHFTHQVCRQRPAMTFCYSLCSAIPCSVAWASCPTAAPTHPAGRPLRTKHTLGRHQLHTGSCSHITISSHQQKGSLQKDSTAELWGFDWDRTGCPTTAHTLCRRMTTAHCNLQACIASYTMHTMLWGAICGAER
jgi:hypothetical protein